MTVLVPDILDWVTFADDDGPGCYGRAGATCPMEPVVRAHWRRICDCPEITNLCLSHRDGVVADSAISNGRFRCWPHRVPSWLLRIEPIR